jgi:hypothetical protein
LNKLKKYNIASIVLLIILIIIGYNFGFKENIKWEKDKLSWDNFKEIKKRSDGFHADIFSDIQIQGNFRDDDFQIFAFMNPNESHKLKDSLTDQLLIHEKYHFNITEYYARLFRKEVAEIGRDNLTQEKLNTLKFSFIDSINILQKKYDDETDHNVKWPEQRIWELNIDDKLRETEIYKKTYLASYSKYQTKNIGYFKEVLLNYNNEFLTSYPVNESMIKLGEVYQILKYKDSAIAKFYKNGLLLNEGNYDTAILKLIKNSDSIIEMHYLNPDRTHNLTLPYQILKKTYTKDSKIINQYYNQKNKIVPRNGSYKRITTKLSNDKFITSFFDENENPIYHSDGFFKERKTLDSLGRIILIESLGKDLKYCVDRNDLSSAVKYVYDINHNLTQRTYYNLYGKHAKNINQYNVMYTYDDLGNTKEMIVLDEQNKKIEDQSGICTYKYWSDLHDNIILIKRYNSKDYPILGAEDYFKSINDFDKKNRIIFDAQYYFLNRLKFSEDDKWGATKYQYLGDSIELRYNFDVYNNHFNDDTGVATVKNYLNKNGLADKVQFLDENGNFAKTKDKVVQYLYEYDKDWNTIEKTTLDSIGVKTPLTADITTKKWEYNSDGEKTKTTYFTKEGTLAKTDQKASCTIFTLSDKNYIEEIRYFNEEMKPTEIDGIHIKKYIANRFGKDSILSCYNKSGKLINGVAITKFKYNFFSSLIEESYFDKNLNHTLNLEGFSYKRYLLNAEQQSCGYTIYDTGLRKTNNKYGFHYEKISVNNYNYPTVYQYFDKRNRPSVNVDGYHKLVYGRDSLGEVISYKQFDKFNRLKEDAYGIAENRYERAKSGIIKTVRNFDSKGKLTNDQEGIAETFYKSYLDGLYYIDKELDENGKEVKIPE